MPIEKEKVSRLTEENSFKGNFGSGTFQKDSYLKEHISIVHERRKFFECDKCNAKFARNHTLKLHVLSEHEGKSLACHICYRKFIYDSSLKAHISEVHERSKNPFQCDKCNATFARNHNMVLHIASEHKGISFECNICSKNFFV